ncbi:hypothetical protein [Planctomicrobium sp. SH664]|uniref:hypothetical protein n=1 Tax=Planctomicrobium sp. SH664 TaxID=3448125 RepID=UPI003F5B1676
MRAQKIGSQKITRALALWAFLFVPAGFAFAQPEGYAGNVATDKPLLLYRLTPTRQPVAIPPKLKITSLDSLQFTGPRPSDPFVLGNFAADGSWGIANGYLQALSGKNSAVQLCWADQFELTGVAKMAGFGGWFLLLGWDQGRGYAVHNPTLMQSGSPWFLSELRGTKAIEGRTMEFDKFEWKGEQPFSIKVANSNLTVTVGKFTVINTVPLHNYSAGSIVVGVYDTKYGPRAVGIKSLSIRALPPVAPATETSTPAGGGPATQPDSQLIE